MKRVLSIFVLLDAGEKDFDMICAGCAHVRSSLEAGWVKPRCILKEIETTWDGYCKDWQEPDGYQ